MCKDLDYMEKTEADCYACKKKITDKAVVVMEWEVKPLIQEDTVYCSKACVPD